jgi:hypothetical protein
MPLPRWGRRRLDARSALARALDHAIASSGKLAPEASINESIVPNR